MFPAVVGAFVVVVGASEKAAHFDEAKALTGIGAFSLGGCGKLFVFSTHLA
jgi:hypothetical protein